MNHAELSDAVAASAGFPGLVGPLRLATSAYDWTNRSFGDAEWRRVEPPRRYVTLWDGGVYENGGLEPVYKNRQLQHDIDFLIVSDGGTPIQFEHRRLSRKFPFYLPAYRLVEIATDQVRGLRARDVVTYFSESGNGIYLRLGRSASYIHGKSAVEMDRSRQFLADETCLNLQRMSTHLRKINRGEFDALERHGEETAEVTFDCYVAKAASRAA